MWGFGPELGLQLGDGVLEAHTLSLLIGWLGRDATEAASCD
jgi:hypothetical protein